MWFWRRRPDRQDSYASLLGAVDLYSVTFSSSARITDSFSNGIIALRSSFADRGEPATQTKSIQYLSTPPSGKDFVLLSQKEAAKGVQSAMYLQTRTEFFFLSFPLLLCLKLVADASPHHGAGTTFYTRPPSCS